jgi:hypothetical protein
MDCLAVRRLHLLECDNLGSHRVDEIRAVVDAVFHERWMLGQKEGNVLFISVRYRQRVTLECSGVSAVLEAAANPTNVDPGGVPQMQAHLWEHDAGGAGYCL